MTSKNKRVKNLKTSSLSDEKEVKEEVVKEIIKDAPEPKSVTTVDVPVPTPQEAAKNPEVQKKIISPLLSEVIEVKDHARGIGPSSTGANTNPAPDLGNLKVDNDFFSTQAVNPTLTKADLSSEKKTPVNQPNLGGASNTGVPPLPSLKPDVPEQSFNTNPAGADQVAIPDNVSKQAASELADTIMSMYERLLPEVSHEYTKINVKEIKKLESSGDLQFGAHADVVTQNAENKRELEKRAKDDATLIKKPLRKLLEVKQINAPPHIELLIILVFVALTYFMMVRGIKKSNDDLLAKLYEKINSDKKGTGVTKDPESDVAMVVTETVIK